MNRHLIFKLLLINIAVIALIMVVVWVAIDTLAAGYFVTLMEKYNISPEPAHAMFVSAVHRYLIWAVIGALILAILLSLVMMRRVLSPLTKMTVITRKIAAGNFSDRVPAVTKDEIGQLALAFNSMAENLETIENLRRTLMIDVAHELRTPLTNIRGYLEALNDRVIPPSTQTFSLLQKETLRIIQLVEDVLHLAKADAAHGHLKLNTTDLKVMVKAVLETFSDAFAEKSIVFNLHAKADPVMVKIDQDRIIRVLRNLTDNAVRYAPQNGTVDIRIDFIPKQVTISFTNNIGDLLPEDLPFIFERFYRGEKSRSRQHGGAGIGLSIVKELVEAHGGSVGADQTDSQVRIWFCLPEAALITAS